MDASGTVVKSWSYNANGQVTTASLADGLDEIAVAYPASLTRTVTDSLGEETTYILEVQNGVVRVSSYEGPGCGAGCSDGESGSYTYTDRQQVSTRTDGVGTVTTYTYDERGNNLTETRAFGTALARTVTTTWNINFRKPLTVTRRSVTAGKSRVASYTYDAKGNVLTKTISGWYGTTPLSATTTYIYDSLGRLLTVDGPRTDVNDITTLSWYPNTPDQGNNRGQLHTVTNALGHTVTYSNYTALGKPGTITDANNLVTTFAYNLQGEVVSTTTDGITATYTRDAAGRVTVITVPGAGTLTLTYAGDLVTAVTDSSGNTIRYTHDSQGRRIGQSLHDPQNTLTRSLSMAYSAAGNLNRITYPDTAVYEYTHDGTSRLIEALDPTGLDMVIDRDGLGRVLSVTEGGVATRTYAYDNQDNLVSATDAAGNTTTYTYDDLGHVRSVSSPDTGLSTYAYYYSDT